eukprot:763720-Hanusia_phi.AAC.5
MQHHTVDDNPPLLEKNEKPEIVAHGEVVGSGHGTFGLEESKLLKASNDQPKSMGVACSRKQFLDDLVHARKVRSLEKGKVHTLKEALRILGAQRSEQPGKDSVQPLVKQIHNILQRLEGLQEEWKEGIQRNESCTRELCQLKVEHTQVLETSYLLRDAYDKQIARLKQELHEKETSYHDAENRYQCMAKLYQNLEISSRKEEEKHARFASQILQKHSEIGEIVSERVTGLETSIADLNELLSLSKSSISSVLSSSNKLIVVERERCRKLEESKKAKDAQLKKLLLLVKDLEGRAKTSLERLEHVEEERLSLQASLSKLSESSAEKDILIQQLDRQCAEYESALITSKSVKDSKKGLSMKQLNSKHVKLKSDPEEAAVVHDRSTSLTVGNGRDAVELQKKNENDCHEMPASRRPLMEKTVNRQSREVKASTVGAKRSEKETKLVSPLEHVEVKQSSASGHALSDRNVVQTVAVRHSDPTLQVRTFQCYLLSDDGSLAEIQSNLCQADSSEKKIDGQLRFRAESNVSALGCITILFIHSFIQCFVR